MRPVMALARVVTALRPPRWRTVFVLLAGALLVSGGALAGAGWYYANALKDEALAPDHSRPEFDVRIERVESRTVTLIATPEAADDGDWTKEGTFGLEWESGYGQVGSIVEADGRRVVREFTAMNGRPQAGDLARLDSFAFPGDPQQALGLPFEDVTFSAPLGEYPAWFIGGSGSTWAIFVHGKGADRAEAFRMLPVFHSLDIPSLVITYRNDEGPGGLYRYGETEWHDLDAAATYAVDHGAEELVLIGYSMGGGIVMEFLYESDLADRVTGVVLEAPMLDFDEVVDWGARDRFLPWPVKPVGKAIAGWRFDVNWDKLNYLRQADRLDVPMLVFHGEDDPKIPVATSEALARVRPDLVTLITVPGAGHVRSWNADPAAYEAAVRDFLTPP